MGCAAITPPPLPPAPSWSGLCSNERVDGDIFQRMKNAAFLCYLKMSLLVSHWSVAMQQLPGRDHTLSISRWRRPSKFAPHLCAYFFDPLYSLYNSSLRINKHCDGDGPIQSHLIKQNKMQDLGWQPLNQQLKRNNSGWLRFGLEGGSRNPQRGRGEHLLHCSPSKACSGRNRGCFALIQVNTAAPQENASS